MHRLHGQILSLAKVAFFIVGLAFLFAPWFFFPALLTHFVWVYTLGAWVCVGLATAKKRRRWLIIAGLLTLWCLWPFNFISNNNVVGSRLLYYNANVDNPNPQADIARILACQPDMVALVEQNDNEPRWRALVQHYPYRCSVDGLGAFSLWFGSKVALQSCETGRINGAGWLRVTSHGHIIYLLHPPPPITALLAQWQQHYFQAVNRRIMYELDPQLVVVGDLNLTPFSPRYWRLIYDTGLSSRMINVMPTWRPGMLHLDQVLSRDNSITVETLPWWHSDHRALLLHLTALPAKNASLNSLQHKR